MTGASPSSASPASARGADIASWLAGFVRDIPDFPQPGVTFKDITPLLGSGEAFAAAVDALAGPFSEQAIDLVAGIEARGFMLAAPVARALGAGFVPFRKVGKLPGETRAQEYALEYGTDHLEVHADAIAPGQRVLVVDDVIATGGTAAAAAELVESLGGEVVSLAFLIELAFLGGSSRLGGRPHMALVTYGAGDG
jgi:adenine phosphoribosyltransferase